MNTKLNTDPIGRLYAERARLNPVLGRLQEFMTALPWPLEYRPRSGPVRRLIVDLLRLAFLSVAAGVTAAFASHDGFAALLVLPTLLFSLGAVGRLRKITVGHKHESGHGVGFASWRRAGHSRKTIRAVRFTIMEIGAVIALAGPGIGYMRQHARHHALRMLGTGRDPDGAALLALGFRQGLSRGAFRKTLLGCLFDPMWYARENLKRLRATTASGSLPSSLAATLLWIGLIASAFVLPFWVWLAALGGPWLLGFPAASLLQVITEHPYVAKEGATDLASYAARTWDRIPWQITPERSPFSKGGLALWLRWTARFVFIHFPSRLAVLDRTMIWHRMHHLAWPMGQPFDDWWNIDRRVACAWYYGMLFDGWEEQVLEGLPEALLRQERYMEAGPT